MLSAGASTTTRHAVLVSSPGMSHLTSFLGLAKRLSSLHSFKVTILFVSSGHAPAAEQYLADVNLVNIPAADISNMVKQGAHLVTKIIVLMQETAPAIRASISILKPITVVVLDFFATAYLPIARELALPCFMYVENAWCLALHVHFPVLDKELQGDEYAGPIHIPGCKPVRPEDVMEPMLKRNQPPYTELVRIGSEIPLFDGVIIKTWQDVEGFTLTALRKGNILRVPVYDIGPIIIDNSGDQGDDVEKVLMEWLDCQPTESVVYISFGSGGTLSAVQMNELALGLELSHQRFLWVVRPPASDDGDASGAYLGFNGGDNDDFIDRYLPDRFKERTRDVGLLVPQWAPQLKVLSHPSVGGFLTHCGWNSISESLTKGVPMMAWPMYAEQRMNAALIVEELKVAVRASDLPASKTVGREEIAKTLRVLLEGDEGRRLRSRAKDLQRGAAQALSPNGSSYNRLSDFVQAACMESCANRNTVSPSLK